MLAVMVLTATLTVLFLLMVFVALLTWVADTKSVALGVATVVVTAAGNFAFKLLNFFTGAGAVKAALMNALMLALVVTVGLLALTVVALVDKYKK